MGESTNKQTEDGWLNKQRMNQQVNEWIEDKWPNGLIKNKQKMEEYSHMEE